MAELNALLPEFKALNIDVFTASVDPEAKAKIQLDEVQPGFDVGVALSLVQMQMRGLYISHPRSPEEHDRPFAEPGLFVINAESAIQIIDISNAPFTRPD
ncbi:hypothetical protein IQ266_10995 [filamentous cyanobacterium LEGE 11480]|uniref:Uncharacterized protein n=1 Tax=Romeriopsis navalis LEGE 11480 TaxID=2777977 RepID=A0A928Z3Q4_9CYAN|nr:hypothetical protein [Romeriopsis navalis]MBE9030257.1 hypothetical protein [Romeriopsis navalis LEGE 11480]